MKILAQSCYLQVILLIFNECVKQIYAQQTNYNECNIEHCMSCDQSTKLCTQCESGYQFSKEELLCLSITTCPEGKYKLTQESNCQDCVSTCKSCFGSTMKECLNCIDGYFFIQDFGKNTISCVSCAVKNCQKCYSPGVCSVCADGYIINKVTGKCDLCSVDFCQECNTNISTCQLCFSSYTLQTTGNTQVCQVKGECVKGFYKDSGSCNSQCDISCKHCYGAGNDKCYECATGYFLSGNVCLQCNTQCTKCSKQKDYCTSCPPGFMLNGNKCLQNCNYGEYNNNGKCEPCSNGCAVCSDFNSCSQCYDPVQFTLSEGKCINVCPSGKYNQLNNQELDYYNNYLFNLIVSKPNCQSCSSNCKECSVYSSSCTACKDGAILTNGKCASSCQSTEYLDYDPNLGIQRCISCPFPCNTCDDRFSCKSCISPNTLTLQNGKCNYQGGYSISNCDEGQVYYSNLCLDKCPDSTILQGDQCQCDFSCNGCLLNISNLTVECIKCKNTSYFSINGVCQTACPKNYYQTPYTVINGLSIYKYNKCVDKCPSDYPLSQISKDKRECVKSCSSGYTLYQNTMCINLPCSSGTYFDNDAYLAVLNSQGDLSNTSLFCKPCDSSCAMCDGKLNTNCLKCIDNYMTQKKTSTNGLTSTYCVAQCDGGYIQTKYLQSDNTYTYSCTICSKTCQTCLSSYYKILSSLLNPQLNNNQGTPQYDCYEKCPSGTEADVSKLECRIKTTINVQFSYTDSVSNKFCIQSNINVILSITTILQFSTNPNPTCTLVELNLPLDMKNNISGNFSKYQAVIASGTLEEGKKYNVKCSLNVNGQTYEDTELLETIQLVKGKFEINRESGYAVNDTFSFSMNGFSLKDINQDSYTLKYKLDAELATISTPFSNITIFQTDSIFFHDKPALAKNFAYIFNYTFPQIKISMSVKIYLTVYGVSTLKRVFSSTINLKPFSETDNLQAISAALKNVLSFIDKSNNFQLTLSDLKQFSDQLKIINLVPYLDNSSKQDIAKQKMLSNRPYIDNLIKCDSTTDCSGKGKCKTNIESYYNKCTCDDGYSGETCAWKKVDLDLVKKVYFNSLDVISSEISGILTLNLSDQNDKLNNLVDQLNSMVSVRDIFDTDVATKFLEIISNKQLYQVLTIQSTQTTQSTQNTVTKLLQLNDQAIDILRKTKSEQPVRVQQIDQIKDNFIQSLYNQYLNLKPGQDSSFSLNNVNGQLKDLSYSTYGQNTDVYMEGTDTNKWKVKIPTTQLGYIASYLYSQVIVWPSDLEELVHNYSETEFNLGASNIIDITIRQRDYPNEEFPIKNSSEQIEITLSRQIKDSDLTNYHGSYNVTCNYQQANGTWTSQGLTQKSNNSTENIICYSNHLTNFALRIQSYNSSQFEDDSDNEEVSQGGFNKSAFLIINFIVLLVTGHVWASIVARKQMKFINNQREQAISQQLQLQQQQQHLPLQQGQNMPDSIFNNPSPILGNIGKDIKLEGIHVAIHEEPHMIEGVPIFNLEEQQKKPENKKQPTKAPNLQINQIDINNVNMLQRSPERYDKIAQNIARRAKEAEIDMCHAEQQKNEQDGNSREVNLIPISTFYQPLGQGSPEFTADPNGQMQIDQVIPFSLEVKGNLPQGVPVNEDDEEKKEASVQSRNQPFIKNKQHQDHMNKDMITYHPFFSFTRNLESVSIPIRIFLFFQIFSLYEYLTMITLVQSGRQTIRDVHLGYIIQGFFQVMLTKSILQYAIPLFLYFMSALEKFCLQRIKYATSSMMKYICIIAFNLYILIAFTKTASSLQSMSDFYKFILVLIINVFIDYFIFDFVVIKLQQCCKSTFILKLIKNKNLDTTY